MNTRIRYVTDENGVATSTRVINTNHGEVLVRYNTTNKVVWIYSAADPNRVYDTFGFTKNDILKKDIKRKLIAMGAEFAAESRERKDESV